MEGTRAVGGAEDLGANLKEDLSISYGSGAPHIGFKSKTRSRTCNHTLPCVLQL
jgi:hypothetical protein